MRRAILAVIASIALVMSGTTVATTAHASTECYSDYTIRVDLPYDGDGVVVCGQTSLGPWVVRNDSDTIWALTSAQAYRIYVSTPSVRSSLFHASARSWYPYTFLAPGDSAVVPFRASGVKYAVQPDLALAWLGFDLLVDQVEDETRELIGDVVTGSSARRDALWACSLALYDAAREYDDSVTWESDPEGIWEYAQGVIEDGGECAQTWATARNTKKDIRFPAYSNVVLEVTSDIDLTAQAVRRLSATQNVLDDLGLDLVCLLPRIRGIGC